MILDPHASCHHHRTFPGPDQFDPRRTGRWKDQGFSRIPQGAGRVGQTHRCPGERLTVAPMRPSIGRLTDEIRHTVPEQDLPSSHIPTQRKPGFLVTHIRAMGYSAPPDAATM
ncbi:MAG: hypothetical protein ACK4IA_15750 [Paracoccus hibiscisoli]|uniref:hypothetical protein n=1 Tax=Paracoccus hibiscisoli TaxID=2023261 RepID=UPI0039194961